MLQVTYIDFFTQKSSLPTYPIQCVQCVRLLEWTELPEWTTEMDLNLCLEYFFLYSIRTMWRKIVTEYDQTVTAWVTAAVPRLG